MNLTLDIGNTAVKWATFEGHTLVGSGYWVTENGERRAENGELRTENIERVMVCASGDMSKVQPLLDSLKSQVSILDSTTPLPIRLDYKTPATLGPDRVAAACGAHALHAGQDCLVIDAGTCITVDFVSADGVYRGGAIMPGLKINLQALHTFTAKLPLLDIEGVAKAPVLGRSTEESILAGTLGATMLALAGFVAAYRERRPGLRVLLTGGDADRLVAAGATAWEHVPHLTLVGLNEILTNGE